MTAKTYGALVGIIAVFTAIDYLIHLGFPLGVDLFTLSQNNYFMNKFLYGVAIIFALYYFRSTMKFLSAESLLSMTGVLLQFRYAYAYPLSFVLTYAVIHYFILYVVIHLFEKYNLIKL